ncbi:hypothetical protein [Bradyrhizobium septentrionale]
MKFAPPLHSGSIQEAFNRSLHDMAREVAAKLIQEKIREQGVHIAENHLASLVDGLLQANSVDAVTVDDGGAGEPVEIIFDRRDEDELSRRLGDLEDQIPSLTNDFTEKVSTQLLSTLKRGWQEHATEQKDSLDGFRSRIAERWGAGLEELDCSLQLPANSETT